MKLRSAVRSSYFRSATFRRLWNLMLSVAAPSRGISTGHLAFFDGDEALGPIQRDEALMLFSAVRMMRPCLVVEFGFGRGHSTFNFLQALDAAAVLHSFDCNDTAEAIARKEFGRHRNFVFHKKSQAEFSSSDIGDAPVDFVFFDASHDLRLNVETFRRIAPCLSPDSLIAIHDTGLWQRRHLTGKHRAFADRRPDDWLTPELFQHRRGEREFVNWIISENPDRAVVHFHCSRAIRHGLTFVGGARSLATVPAIPAH